MKLRDGGAGEAVGLHEISHDLSQSRGRGTSKGLKTFQGPGLSGAEGTSDFDIQMSDIKI